MSWHQVPWNRRPVFFFQRHTYGYTSSRYVTSSLTRGRVCRLQLLLVLANAVNLGSESHRNHGHMLLSQFRDSPNLECQVPYLYPPKEQDGPVIPPGTGFHFPSSSLKIKVKVTLRLTVSQSVSLGVETHLGLMTRYLLLFWQLRSCFLWGALSDERTGLSFVCAAGPC
jgi:hypothetical protein